MMISKIPNHYLYLLTFAVALITTLLTTPLMRFIALRLGIMDAPHSSIKTHKHPIPYLGGMGIWFGWIMSLIVIRFFTDFPTGTLRSLRGIITGSVCILLLGLVDDCIPKGLGFKKKFLVQILAAILVIWFDVRLHFVSPYSVAVMLSIVWIIGVTNAYNIIDIMDGLSSGLAAIASLAFLFITLPTEHLYVNFCAVALAGGCIGFLPYNLSNKYKIFMGDTGSLAIGFILASVSMGSSYTRLSDIGILAPLLILAIPIYDTFLVMYLRIMKGQSPFLGSRDHFALRLEIAGLSRKQILVVTYIASAFLSYGAYLVTRLPFSGASIVFALVFVIALFISYNLNKIKVS